MYGMRFVVTTHGSDLHYLSRDKRLIGLIRDALNVSALITANSAFTRKWFLDMFGRQYEPKLRTIAGGVYLEEYKHNHEICKLIDEKYNLKGKKVVLFTGRLTPQKGVDYLIKAAQRIKGEVLILGDGPERENLQKLIDSLKLTNCRILGYMSPKEQINFKAFYGRADVYVAPSTWNEPLGLVVLEAMAAKTPVVTTRSGGIMSLVKDGYNGYLVRMRNSTEIAARVNELLLNDELCKKMGERSYDLVVKKFTWDRIAAQFEAVYKNNASSAHEYLRLVKAAVKPVSPPQPPKV
jgi:glycosyltransferase involved in cell wall biosynthesis